MTDQDVRDMLSRQATSVRPSADGWEKIETKLAAPASGRRPVHMPLLVAAALVAVALIGVAVFAQRDEATSVNIRPTAAPVDGGQSTEVPANAVSPDGRLDGRETVIAYLTDRLQGHNTGCGSRTPTSVASPQTTCASRIVVNEVTLVDDTHGEVTWNSGVVKIVKSGRYWFVTEAIGDSIQITGTSLDVGLISGTITLAQAGTVHLLVGDTSWDVRNDVDREGTDVVFDHEVPTDEPVILRAVFDTDTGYVSLAERVVG